MTHIHGRPDTEEEHLDDLLGRGLGDPDYHRPPWEIKDDSAVISLQERQVRDIFFASDAFKEAEEERMETFKPKEHEPVDFARVYCPIYDKIRAEWLCVSEHGDSDEVDRSDWDG